MNATFIQKRLAVFYGNHQYMLRNSYIFDWESDLFSVTKTGTIYETEIKISRSDFKADFEKSKHRLFQNHKKGLHQQRREDETEDYDWDATGNEIFKKYSRCWQKWVHSDEFFIPHRFSFACPPNVIKLTEVPKYAGLIWVFEDGSLEIHRQGPILHKRPIMKGEKMMEILRDKFYYLAAAQQRELERVTRIFNR